MQSAYLNIFELNSVTTELSKLHITYNKTYWVILFTVKLKLRITKIVLKMT